MKGLLWQRVLSAAVGIPLLISLVLVGGWPLMLGVIVLALVGTKEYNAMLTKMDIQSPKILSYIAVVLLPLTAFYYKNALPALLTFLLILYLVMLLLNFPKSNFSDNAASFFGVVYIGWLLSHLVLLRQSEPFGAKYLLLVFILTWATDTGAYFVGRSFGRHKLAPVLSPNKTIEGAIGGLLGSLCAVAVIYRFDSYLPSVAHGMVLALLVGIFGQFGDLIESVLKRFASVKDSGTLIPGHGGVLDRFDSILLTAPVVYYYIYLFILV